MRELNFDKNYSKFIKNKDEVISFKDNISGDKEFKLQFLNELYEKYNIRTLNQTITLFKNTKKWEDLFNRDIYNFDLNQFKIFLKDLRKPSIIGLAAEKSLLDNYLYYAQDRKKIDLAMHPSFNIKQKDLNEFVSTLSRKNKYITFNEYKELLKVCKNKTDAALLVLLWNGLYNKELEYICNFTKKNFVKDREFNEIIGIDGEVVFIEKFEKEILLEAFSEKSYFSVIKNTKTDYIETEYLFKHQQCRALSKAEVEGTVGSIKSNTLTVRFKEFKVLINNKDIQIKSIVVSGAYYRAKKMNFEKRSDLNKYMLSQKMTSLTAKEVIQVINEKELAEKKQSD